MIKHNIGYKLLSLLIAILVWAYVSQYVDHGRQAARVIRELAIPVTMRNLGDGLVVTSKPGFVKVTLDGPREYVDTITTEPDSVTANLFLNRRSEGRHRLPVIVKLPEGYTGLVSTSTNPLQLAVAIEKMARKTERVETEFTASPPVGFRFSAPLITPGRLTVSGMGERVRNVKRLVVMIDPTASDTGVIDADLPVRAVDDGGNEVNGVQISSAKVKVHLELERAPVSKVVFVTPSISGHPPFPYKVLGIDVKPQSVTLNGRPERLMEISTASTEPLALGAHTKTFSQRVHLITPSGSSLANGRTATITVRIGATEGAE